MRRPAFLAFLMLSIGFSAGLMVPAVDSNMQGVLVNLTCELVPGHGRVLVTTDPYIGVGTQESERTATAVAKTLVGNFSDKDVIFIFSAANTGTIDGGSAGMAMAVCLMSEINNDTISPGVSITGGIDSAGRVMQVAGILQKAKAVSQFARVFLIPAGQSKTVTYAKEFVNPREGIYIEEARPVEIDIAEYAAENWNLSIVEFTNISQAYDWMTKNITARPPFQFAIPKFTRNLTRVNELADMSVARARKLVNGIDANESIALDYLNKAAKVGSDFPYTRANYAFLAAVASQTSLENVDSVANEMSKQLQKFETSDPYWRAETELRLSWALFKDNSFIAKKDWLLIAANMFALERTGNRTLDIGQVKKLANQKILEAKEAVEQAKIVAGESRSAEEALTLAVKSYDADMYFAALYNALDAIAWADASKGASRAYLQSVFSSPKTDEFSEAYRRHAIYLLTHSGGDPSLIETAIFSARRADLREGVFGDMKNLPISFSLPAIDWKLLLILVLGAYTARNVLGKRKKGRAELTEKDMIMLAESKARAVKFLQEKLKDKEITRETYVKLVRELEGL